MAGDGDMRCCFSTAAVKERYGSLLEGFPRRVWLRRRAVIGRSVQGRGGGLCRRRVRSGSHGRWLIGDVGQRGPYGAVVGGAVDGEVDKGWLRGIVSHIARSVPVQEW